MHSSGMRTAHLLTVSRSIRWGGGMGVSAQGIVCPGGCLLRGVSAWGCLPRGVSARVCVADTPLTRGRHTPVKT